jgi:hypothetical protein
MNMCDHEYLCDRPARLKTVTPTSPEITAFKKLIHKEAVNVLHESASETVIIHSLYYTQVHHTAVTVMPKIYLAGSEVLTLLFMSSGMQCCFTG